MNKKKGRKRGNKIKFRVFNIFYLKVRFWRCRKRKKGTERNSPYSNNV